MEMKEITKYLPEGWEQKCGELKALLRSRNIKSPADLLEMILTYLTIGESLNLTAGIMKMKNVNICKVSLFERLQKSGDWLKWLVENTLKKHGIMLEKPEWLGDKNVYLVDGSDVSLKGKENSYYRLHMMFDLFNFCYKSLEITTMKDGEKLSKFPLFENSVVIGDRGYINKSAIEYAKENKSNFIFRYRTKVFNLHDKNGTKIDLLKKINELSSWESQNIDCYYMTEKGLKPIRICVMKKDERSILATNRKMKRLYQLKQIDTRMPDTVELNKYIILCTDLDYDAEKIFELYRCRWQIELVFKELKTTLSFGELPASNPDSIKAWFYGKLLIASLSLLILSESHFSPKD